MPEWSTYSLANFLMFSARTYYRLFERHNAAVWPAHLAALAAGVIILVALFRPSANGGRISAALLAAAWLFVAWAYLFRAYSTIHWAGRYFAAAFAAQAGLLLWRGVVRPQLSFASRGSAAAQAGLGLFAFALLLQPLAGLFAGRPWTQLEVFGLTPDPTATATLGLLVAVGRAGWMLWPIPLGWCAFSTATLWTMHPPDWFVLPLLGLVSLAFALSGRLRGGGVIVT